MSIPRIAMSTPLSRIMLLQQLISVLATSSLTLGESQILIETPSFVDGRVTSQLSRRTLTFRRSVELRS